MEVLADFARRRGITFSMLSDAGSAVIKRYAILNTTLAPTDTNYGIPFPGTFILNADGIVTARFFEAAYQERNTMASVLLKLGKKLNVPATKVTGPYLSLSTYLSDQVVAPGTRFSLVMDVIPDRRVHVYAPGVTGYKPIALTLGPQIGVIVRGAQFPKPEDYFFKPLNEHVLVYQQPFKIVYDLEIDPTPPAVAALQGQSSLKIEGVLAYQACDDKVCFLPQSIPLSWTVALKPLDRERAQPLRGR